MSDLPGPELPDDPDEAGDTLHVPDDISSLAADVVAFRREQSARRRRQRWERVTGWTTRFRWYGVSVPVVAAALLVVGGLGAMLVLLGPHGTTAGTASGSRAAASTGRPGEPILPVRLTRPDGSDVGANVLGGPAVLLLVPVDCGCTSAIAAVRAAAGAAHLAEHVVTQARPPAGQDVLIDPGGVLLTTYGHVDAAPTLLHLDSAGIVDAVTTGVSVDRAATAVANG